MLRLILGRGKTGKTHQILKAVQACPAQGMAQRIVIVPEQLSHNMERSLSRLCGDSISFVSEVLSFTRLYDRVCSIAGGGATRMLDASGRILTARLALDSIRPKLKVFASAAGKPEFLTQMVSMIDELKSYRITPELLQETSRDTTGLFAEKLSELSLILGSYEAVTAQGTADPRDRLSLLKKKLEQSDYGRGRYFFVDGFTDFSAQELAVLQELLGQCVQMTITVPCDSLSDGEGLFDPGRETAQTLFRMAQGLGIPVEVTTAEFSRPLPEELTYLEKNLFGYDSPVFPGQVRSVYASELEDRLQECIRCGGILKQAAMEGIRYRDMMVCTGDEPGYGPLLETIFRTMGIPLYRTEKRSVMSHPAVAFVLLALEAATDGFETETVIAYLKTGYSDTDRDLCDLIENYAVTWAIRGNKWRKVWVMHPDGYDGKMNEEAVELLEQLNEGKDRAMAPLLRLKENLSHSELVQGQMEALYHFLEETGLYHSLEQQIQQDVEQGRQESAQETAQIWEMLMECLQQITDVLGSTQQKTEDILRILKLALSQYQVGTIPAVLDAVTFGGIDKARGQEPKLMYVLGANQGVLPTVVSGGSLLTERERTILRDRFQLQLAPDSEGNLQRQLLTIYSCFTAPRERLYISCCQKNAGEDMEKSFLYQRLETMFQELSPIPQPETIYTTETAAEAYLITMGDMENGALHLALSRAAQEITEMAQAIVRGQTGASERQEQVARQEAVGLFHEPVILSASKLDQLASCPLRFFLNYGLQAKVRKEATFDASEFGTFIHHVLEKTVAKLSQKPQIQPLSYEECEKMVQEELTDYAETRLGQGEQSPRAEYLFQRNGQEAALVLEELTLELGSSQFHPEGFELKFGETKGLAPLEIQGKLGRGLVTGLVDRADVWQDGEERYLRIVDYKSGSKTFDYTELYHGMGMQMLLYLFALKEQGLSGDGNGFTPAGVLYVPAKHPYASGDPEASENKSQKRSGLVLEESQVLNAMEPGEQYAFLPIRATKKGLGDYAISRNQFDQLQAFISLRSGQAVDRILSGRFQPEPCYRGQTYDPCNHCEFGSVCQKDPKFRQKYYREKLSGSSFWENIGGDENE